tara:strand:+ start:890 stop:1843 length:954 start_codon:yes stop_codon:yes gene_type:complete
LQIDKINEIIFKLIKLIFFSRIYSNFKQKLPLIPKGILAIILMIVSGFCFVVMHSAVKYLSQEIHPFEIAFFRNVFVALVLAPIIVNNGYTIFITKQPKIHIYRIIFNSVALICFFYGLSITTLAEATALGFTVPIFATILSILFLKEVIRIRRLTALILGFIGTLIVIRPDISIEIGSFLIIFSAFLWSICLIFIKQLTKTDNAITISLYAGIGLIPATLFVAIPVWTNPTFEQIVILFFISFAGTLAQTLMNSALARGEVAMLLPFDFLRLIWSALLGYTLFFETPEITLWLGGILILGSTSYIAWREMRLKNIT